ncbi:hypothetical protein KR222_008273 [Zaprionus bogoriensis]|nr:hypothetical protein KR222_008273 [Zaprionus bogoriensis]
MIKTQNLKYVCVNSKEMVRMERKTRSNYPIVWTKIADNDTNKFYHQDEIDKLLQDKLKLQDVCPYRHDGKGDSHFISPEMHKNLLEICRCGRPRRGIHMGKCLQRALTPSLCESPEETATKPNALRMPPTSNCKLQSRTYLGTLFKYLLTLANIGFRAASYRKLEQSMQYVSPTYSMPGPRITATPYNSIIIG